MICSICGKEFGSGTNCQHCGTDRISAGASYNGYSAPASSSSSGIFAPSKPVPNSTPGHSSSENSICPFCGEVIPGDAKFCPFCQKALYVECPKCKYQYPSRYTFCPSCGTERQTYLWQKAKDEEEKRLQEEKVTQERRRQEEEKQRYQNEVKLREAAIEKEIEDYRNQFYNSNICMNLNKLLIKLRGDSYVKRTTFDITICIGAFFPALIIAALIVREVDTGNVALAWILTAVFIIIAGFLGKETVFDNDLFESFLKKAITDLSGTEKDILTDMYNLGTVQNRSTNYLEQIYISYRRVKKILDYDVNWCQFKNRGAFIKNNSSM